MDDRETKRNIAANMNRLLTLRSISQNALANLTGESATRINQYVQGKKMPGAGVLSRIAEKLGVTVDELLSPPNGRRRKKQSA